MQKSPLFAIAFTLLLSAGVVWIMLTWMDSEDVYINLNSGISETSTSSQTNGEKSKFRFAVSTIWSPERTFLRYRRFGMKLGQMIEEEETLVIRSSYREVRNDIEAGRVDAALVCTGTLLNITDHGGAQVIATPEFVKGWSYRGIILVSSDSQVSSLIGLKGKEMAMTDPESFTGCILPSSAILSVAEKPTEFFKRIVFTSSHDRAVEAVASHIVDAAAVDGLVYDSLCLERPEIREKTRILWESEPYGPPHILVSASLPKSLREKLKTVLLSLQEDPEGREILKSLNIKRFVAPEPGIYDSAREIFDKVKSAGVSLWH